MPWSSKRKGRSPSDNAPSRRASQEDVRLDFSENPMAVGGVGAGANTSVRRNIVDLVDGFDNVLDAGTATHSGAETPSVFPYPVAWLPDHRRTCSETGIAIAPPSMKPEKPSTVDGVGAYSALSRVSPVVDRESVRHCRRCLHLGSGTITGEGCVRALRRPRGDATADSGEAELGLSLAGPYSYWKVAANWRRAAVAACLSLFPSAWWFPLTIAPRRSCGFCLPCPGKPSRWTGCKRSWSPMDAQTAPSRRSKPRDSVSPTH